MKKCVKKISVVCVVAFAMSMIFSSLAFASQSSSSSQAAILNELIEPHS